MFRANVELGHQVEPVIDLDAAAGIDLDGGFVLLDQRRACNYVDILQAVFFGIMMPLSGSAALIVAIAFMLVVFSQIFISGMSIGKCVAGYGSSDEFRWRNIIWPNNFL